MLKKNGEKVRRFQKKVTEKTGRSNIPEILAGNILTLMEGAHPQIGKPKQN